jgi:hypothetical protein
MRDIHRNPMLYYVLIPVLIGMWPLLVWAKYLPEAKQACSDDYDRLIEGQTHIMGILELDPDRTKGVDPNRVVGEFVYGKAVESVANLCSIPAGGCPTTVGPIVTVSGKRRQDAKVKLKDISIVQAARFLSLMQSNYVNLKCDKIKLTKRKGMPDQWEADLSFIYYY